MADSATKQGISRRGFIKGTAIGAGALVFADLDPKDAKAAPVPKKWDKESDIVVLGAGGAGLFAAIEAADKGSKVILLESEPVRSGSSPIAGGTVALCETEMQPGSRDELYADLMTSHFKDCDPSLIRAYVDNATEAYNRMKEMGVKFTRVSQWAYMKKPWGHDASSAAELCATLENASKKKGVEIMLSTRGKRLVVHPGGRVVGVQADSRGKMRYFKARKAVVIATGGFTRNPGLAKNFGRPGSEKLFPLTGIGSRGDGLIMGWALGADLTYMTVGVGPTAPAEKETAKTVIAFYAGAIIVNKNGKRFHRESDLYSEICWSGLQQPDVLMIQLFDAKIKKSLEGTSLGNMMKGCREYQANTLQGARCASAGRMRYECRCDGGNSQ